MSEEGAGSPADRPGSHRTGSARVAPAYPEDPHLRRPGETPSATGRAPRPDRSAPARPREEGEEQAAAEWRQLRGVIRALLHCDETRRLYPEGHHRVRLTTKELLVGLQEYYEQTGRPFSFVPEVALDLSSSKKSFTARNVTSLALRCRERMIRQLTIRPEVDVEELEALIALLDPREEEPPPGETSELPAREWRHVEIEYLGDEGGAGYRFTESGDQIVPSSTVGGRKGLPIPEHLPPSLRKSVEEIFGDPSVQRTLERIGSRFSRDDEALEPGPATARKKDASSGKRSGDVDLVREIVQGLFRDPSQYMEIPFDELKGKIGDFLRFLEGLAASPSASRAAEGGMTQAQIQEIFRGAIGMGARHRSGLAEISQQSARLRALFENPCAQAAGPVEKEGPTADAATAPRVPEEKRPSKGGAQPQETQPSADESATGHEPQPPSAPEGHDAADGVEPQLPSALDELLAVRVSREKLAKHILTFDSCLEALRIQAELLASKGREEEYAERRDRFLEDFCSHDWEDPDLFASELDITAGVLADCEPHGEQGFVTEVLGRQRSLRRADRYFLTKARSGASIFTLRPILRHLAKDGVPRMMESLTLMWESAQRHQRDAFLDEIYNLAPVPRDLADWAARHPEAFAAPPSLARLKRLRKRSLEDIFVIMIHGTSPLGEEMTEAAVAILRAASGSKRSEKLFALALGQPCGRLRKEALTMLNSCSRLETLRALEQIIEGQNRARSPNLEEIRLSLTALLKSSLPPAKELLKRIRSERRLLRYSYRREIREVLGLLVKARTLKK